MIQVASLALPFFGLILLGFAAGKIWQQDESGLSWLNVYVLYFALPALFFQLISKTPIDQLANWRFVICTMLGTLVAFSIAFGYAALKSKGDIPLATVQGMVGGYGNVGYMGPPLAIVAMGSEAAVPATLIFCFDIALVFTLAPLMMAIGGVGDKPIGQTLLAIPRRVLLHPFILATIAGAFGAALQFDPPEPIDRMITFLSGSAAPCALFALGVTVALRPLRRVPQELPALIGIKLLVHPALIYLILSTVGGFEAVWVYTAILMASLPPAATIYVIAVQYGVYVERASAAILLGTFASVVTVTGWLFALSEGYLPLNVFAG